MSAVDHGYMVVAGIFCAAGRRVEHAHAAGIIGREQGSDRLTRLWETPHNVLAQLATVDHKQLGVRYIVTACVFLALGGVEATVMRLQLARPGAHLLSPETYNQLFTMHGMTMMFLFAQPVLSGFSFYLTPLLIGARELAFPRLNTFSYYVFLLAGVLLYSSFLVGQAPDGGWFNYAPLTEARFDPGYNIDFYAVGLLFLGISTVVGAVNLIVTILKLRAPGMSIDRMPVMLWSSMTMSWSVIFAMPALSVALVFLELDRRWGFAFFGTARGGDPMLWQHLFWVFGHPWVYIVFLPATGMLSMIIPTFSRRPLVGHTFVVLATVATGLLGFGVWVHHMFATGLPQISVGFFSAASMMVSIPSAVQVIAWIATMWHGRVVLRTAMLFAIGFIAQFVIGGISGVMTAVVPFDWQATDNYFVVAHLHYVLAGGTLFAVFSALYYWFPKMTGRLLDERAGKASFWVMFVGFNVAFFPMHIAGLLGMARRVYTYAPGLGLDASNMTSTVGTLVFAFGTLVTLYNVVRSAFEGAPAGADPWGGSTLEWATTSPPEHYDFARMPVVRSRDPLWDGGVDAGPAYDEARLTPRTSPLDAELEAVIELPAQNLWTLCISIALLGFFTGVLLREVWLMTGSGAVTLVSLARWMWPTHGHVLETEV
jgi:cytochrome c oxidase subunit 1/cytochrome c oxidase subunit I+III